MGKMGIVSKSSIKFSVILYSGIILGYINTVLIFPNVLTEEEFGLTRIIFSAAALIAQVTQLGTGNILVRFHPYLKEDNKNTTLTLGLTLSFIGVILSSAILFAFKGKIISEYSEKAKLFTEYYYLLLPAVISLIAFNLFDGYLRVLLKNSFIAFLNSILLRIIWLGIVLLYFFKFFDTNTFINVYVGGQVFISVLAFIYAIKHSNLNLGFNLSEERIKMLKSMTSFGIVTILSGISFLLINRIDVVLVGKYLGLTDVAIYTIAFYMSTVIAVPGQSISRTTGVLVADAFKNNNMGMIKMLYQKTALNQMLFGTVIFMLIAVNYQSLISFLPSSYADSFNVFFLLGLAKIIDTGFGMNGAILINSKYYKSDTILSVALLISSIVLKIYMIPLYGIEGAAASTALVLIVFNLIKYIFLKWKLNLSPFTKNYFYVGIILIVGYLLTSFFPHWGLFWLDIPAKSMLFVLLTIPSIYYIKASPEFNALILSGLKMIGLRTNI